MGKKVYLYGSIAFAVFLIIVVFISFLSDNKEVEKSYEQESTISSYFNDKTNSIFNNETNETVSEPNETVSPKTTLLVPLDENGFVNEYVNDAIILRQYSKTSHILGSLGCCYDYDDSLKKKCYIYKDANEPIPKIKKNSLVGVTDGQEYIEYIYAGYKKPIYMIYANFCYHFGDDKQIETRTAFIDTFYETGCILKQLDEITEINNEEASTFVKNHSIGVGINYSNLPNKYIFITGDKNEEFVFGGFPENSSEYTEVKLKASTEVYKCKYVEGNAGFVEPEIIYTQKTKNGYFSVDFSNLPNGIYYIETYQSFIELVD